ncbi:MAG: site-2 protease family protein [Massiliimalia sp.]|jgi:regulator of sigma E protease
MVWLSLRDLLTGKVGFDQVSGPVGVGSVLGEAAGMGMEQLLILIAFLTINIGIFNLLPIPALDGGRLLFIIIEMIRRKPINRKYEAYIHAAGLILLFALMILITGKDILNLIFPKG